MKKKVFVDEFGIEDEIWGDHQTDGDGAATDTLEAPSTDNKEEPTGDDPVEEPEEKMVPVSAITAEREKRQQAENNFAMLQNQVNIAMQQNQAQKATPSSEVDKLDDEAIVNGRDVKKMFDQMKGMFSEELQNVSSTNRASNAVLLAKASHPDYEEVIKTNLVNVLDANPAFRNALASTGKEFQPLLAYAIGTLDPEYTKKVNAGTTKDIQAKIKENAKKPGSVNVAGGAADNSDLASVIATESQEEFNKRVARIKAKG